jgi:hypothetical protein
MKSVYKVECIEKKNYKKYIFTEEQKDLVVKLYNELGSSVDVGKLFNVGHKVVTKVLEEKGIKRTAAKKRQYKINECYFDEIDTPNKAYILGFLYADGCNCMSKGTITMSLEEGDRDVLERIRHEIDSERPLEFLDYSNKHDFGYTYHNQYRLLLFSSHMCQSLQSHGMVPNKSLVLKFPTLDEKLVPHFIRGYFDGDGCVCQGKRETNFLATITSTNDFCIKLKEIVEHVIGINCYIYDASNHNGITKVFTTSGRLQVKSFLDWIYKDADMFLERKYNRYIQYFYNNEENTNNTLTA